MHIKQYVKQFKINDFIVKAPLFEKKKIETSSNKLDVLLNKWFRFNDFYRLKSINAARKIILFYFIIILLT